MNNTTLNMAAAILVGTIATACVSPNAVPSRGARAWSESRILSCHEKIAIGMTRREVESIVGAPISDPLRQPSGEVQCYYLDEPERQMQAHESPWGFSGLVVEYRNDLLIAKTYNFQWVKAEHRDAYEKRSSEPDQAADGVSGKR